jgi:tetratricopeptide (TPR) repeat protein
MSRSPRSKVLWLAPCLALFATCAAPGPVIPDPNLVGNGRLAEFGTAKIAGVTIDNFEELPSAWTLDRSARARTCQYKERYGEDPPRLEIFKIALGEIESLRIELAGLPNPKLNDGPDYDMALQRTPVSAVIADPRWPSAVGPNAADQARYLGVEIGDLAYLSKEDGALFATSQPGILVRLVSSTTGPHIGRIVHARTTDWVHAEGKVRAEKLQDMTHASLEPYAEALADAVASGSALAAKAQALMKAGDGPGRGQAMLEFHREAFESGDLFARLGLLARLADEMPKAADDDSARAQFLAWCDEFAGTISAQGDRAEEAGGAFESAGWWCLADLLEDVRKRVTRGVTEQSTRALLESMRELDGLPAEERLARHAQWQQGLGSDSLRIERLRAGALRQVLISQWIDSAQDADRRGLRATACVHYMLAHALENLWPASSAETQTLSSAIGDATRNPAPLYQARDLAVRLAVDVLPIFDPVDETAEPLFALYDNGRALAGTPLLSRLALTTGSRHHMFLASTVGTHGALMFELGEPRVTLTVDHRSEIATRTFFDRAMVANAGELTDWERRMSALAEQLRSLNDSIESDAVASRTVTARHGFSDLEYAGSAGGFVYYRRVENTERLSSILARIEAVGRMERNSQRFEELSREYEVLAAQRPPDARLETVSWVVRFPREVQRWKVHVARQVTFVGKDLRHEAPCERSFEVEYEIIKGQSAHGIPDVNEWRTQEQMLADDRIVGVANDAYLLAAVSDYFESRLREMGERVDERYDAPAALEERRCLQWLMHSRPNVDDPELLAQMTQVDQLASWAAAGLVGDIPTHMLFEQFRGETGDIDKAALMAAGIESYNRGDYSSAERLFEACAKLDPKDEAALENLTWACIRSRRFAEALAASERLVEVAPSPSHALMLVGSHALNGDYETASSLMRRFSNNASREYMENAEEYMKSLTSMTSRPGPLERVISDIHFWRTRK